MKKLLIAGLASLAILTSAHAETGGIPKRSHECVGELTKMQDRDIIGDCVLVYDTPAFLHDREWCDKDTWDCRFYGHVAKREKADIKYDGFPYHYFIDRIFNVCGLRPDDCE